MTPDLIAARARVALAREATRFAGGPDEELAALERLAAEEDYLNSLLRAEKLAAGEPVQPLERRRWPWQKRRRPRARPAAGPSASGNSARGTPRASTPARTA